MAKAKITKAEFEALGDEQKKTYELVGESAFYTGEIPDVAGLQSALESERTLRSNAEKALAPYTGLDPVKAKEALAAAQGGGKKEHDLTTKEGLQAALNEMRNDYETKLKERDEKQSQLVTERAIETVLTKAGVIPKALPHAVDAVKKLVKPLGDDPAQLGVVGPTGTFIGTDFETWAANDFKKDSSFFFADSGQGGTGAAQNNRSNTGGGAVVTKSRTEFDAMTPQQKIDFSNQVEQGKAALSTDQ